MKKFKLRRWVKVVLSVIIIGVSAYVYLNLGSLGQSVNKHTIADILVIGGWFWLIVGQTMFIYSIWEA